MGRGGSPLGGIEARLRLRECFQGCFPDRRRAHDDVIAPGRALWKTGIKVPVGL